MEATRYTAEQAQEMFESWYALLDQGQEVCDSLDRLDPIMGELREQGFQPEHEIQDGIKPEYAASDGGFWHLHYVSASLS
jgi:hypothetical protein